MNKKVIKKLMITIVIALVFINLIFVNFTVNADNSNAANVDSADEIVKIIKEAIAKWYYVMRLIVIAFMLVLLLFIGVKMALSTIASEKAVYKQMLIDWIAGMIIVFSIHYIMIFILTVNDSIVKSLRPFAVDKDKMETIEEEYEYGESKNIKTSSEIETTLYESARTRAYSLKLTDGFTGMVIYGVLVYYAWRFAILYFKRLVNIIILTLLAPAVSASYALNKVLTGKAKVFSTWLQEYIMNVMIQVVHIIIYVSFVSIGLTLSLQSLPGVILALILLNFMTKADKLLRKIFKLSGGKGSLSGDMADSSGFSDIKNEFNSLKSAMIGGALTKATIGATYRAATKPIRAVGETAFGGIMAHKANKEEREAKENREEKARLEERQAELEARKADLNQKRQEIDSERAYFWNMVDQENVAAKSKELDSVDEKLKDLQEEYNINQEALENRNKAIELEKMAEEYQKQAIKLELEAHELGFGGVKGGFKQLFNKSNYIEKGKDGKYHAIKTKRKGGVDGAFWREKQDGVGKRFMNNLKFDKFLGIDNEEKKVLQSELNFFKSSILGLMSAAVGMPMLVAKPALGMGLLAQASISGLNVSTRRRKLKNRARKSKQSTSYHFKEFCPAAKRRINQEAMEQIERAQSKMTKSNMKKHKSFVKKIFNNQVSVSQKYAGSTTRFTLAEEEQLEVIYQKKLRKYFNKAQEEFIEMDTQNLVKDYNDQFNKYEQKVKQNVEKQSIIQLAFEDKLNNDNVISIGDNIMEVESEDAIDNLAQKADEIDQKEGLSNNEKINQIQNEINKNQTQLIESAVIKLCIAKGIKDVKSNQINSTEVKQSIVGSLEEKGIIKKGEIDIEEAGISEEKIVEVCDRLSSNKEETKEKMEEKIVQVSLLEYMAKEGITDVRQLKNDQAKEDMLEIIKNKLMPDSMKKTAEVVAKMTGQDSVTENFEVSDNVKQILENKTKKVKKIKKTDLADENVSKKKLVERQVNKELNESKQRLETAMYTDDDDSLSNEDELKLKFLLSQIGDRNIEKEKIKQEFKPIRNETKEKMQYFNGATAEMMESNRDLTDELRYIESKVHGPAVDVIDLINYKTKKNNGKAV